MTGDQTRTWDGSPETERDTRFFDLRDSGYAGPIDQDGYADTASEGAGTLAYMVQQRGEPTPWYTGDRPDLTGAV